MILITILGQTGMVIFFNHQLLHNKKQAMRIDYK